MIVLPLLALIIGDLVMPDASQDQILQGVKACDAALRNYGSHQNTLKSLRWRPRIIDGVGKIEGHNIEYFQADPAVVTIEVNRYDLAGTNQYSCKVYAKVKGESTQENNQIESLIDHWSSKKDAYKNTAYGTFYGYTENEMIYTMRAIYLINGPAVQITVQRTE
jgi:hypothetical protein